MQKNSFGRKSSILRLGVKMTIWLVFIKYWSGDTWKPEHEVFETEERALDHVSYLQDYWSETEVEVRTRKINIEI